MAKVKGIFGSMLSGKLEDVVFVQYKDGTYVRRAPRLKSDKRTPDQVNNQKRFAAVVKFCGQFKKTVIPQIWSHAAEKTTGYRLFLKANSPAFGTDGSLSDPKLIRLSTGKLPLAEELTASRVAAGSTIIRVSWKKALDLGGIRLKDELMVISAASGSYSEVLSTGIVRGSLTGTFELPASPAAATHLYLFFGSNDRMSYSESECVGI